LALIRRLMLAFPCGHYDDAKGIHDDAKGIYHKYLARGATKFWYSCAETEEEKRLVEEYN